MCRQAKRNSPRGNEQERASTLETEPHENLRPSEDPSEVLAGRIREIEARARRIGRRQGLPPRDLDDFVGDVMVKLIEDDYAVLRAFDGRCDLLAFLSSVIRHLAQDERNRRWGKWHPSAAAKCLGFEALILERLLYREGLALTDAEARLRELLPRLESADVERLAGRLPHRTPGRRHVEIDAETTIALTRADDGVLGAERDARKRWVLRALTDGLSTLDPSWRLALVWRYEQGWRAARIARRLAVSTRRVYRIFELSKRRLRDILVSQGIDAETALGDIGWDIRGSGRPQMDGGFLGDRGRAQRRPLADARMRAPAA